MSTAVTKGSQSSLPALKMDESELIEVLQGSLYPGAMIGSVKLVINYCKAAGLDPMQKPVHIVPMYDSKAKAMRDVVMPGIGLYRTQAARSGEYAGVSEPEFGDDVVENVGGIQITYPKWCRVTVRRLLTNGAVVDFTAKELWKENYATKGRDNTAPNAMWQRRPYAQLAKCAEAQALRKAFPEFGAQPTADEMEGRELDMGAADVVASRPASRAQATLPAYTDEQFSENLSTWRGMIDEGKASADQIIARVSSKYELSAEQVSAIRQPATAKDDQNTIDADDWTSSYEQAEGVEQ